MWYMYVLDLNPLRCRTLSKFDKISMQICISPSAARLLNQNIYLTKSAPYYPYLGICIYTIIYFDHCCAHEFTHVYIVFLLDSKGCAYKI
jgi:hypothetical protein